MRVGIVGLGLIGGSLGLALRRLGESIEVTSERRPVPWLGSTITGRWLNSLTRGTALRSSVFRV